MKNTPFVLLVPFLLSLSSSLQAADTVFVIKKIGKDLYEAQNGPYIQTQGCEAFSYSESVVLRDNGLSKMWLVFSDGSVCNVVRLIKNEGRKKTPQAADGVKQTREAVSCGLTTTRASG